MPNTKTKTSTDRFDSIYIDRSTIIRYFQVNDQPNDYIRGDAFDNVGYSNVESTKEIKTTPTTTTEPTTSTTTTTTTSTTSTIETTTTPMATTTVADKKDNNIATGPPALSVPPMCSFRHTQRQKNETCKDAADWRDDAIR